MAEVVGLDGKIIGAEIPRDDRPEDVLERLFRDIKDGTLNARRLGCVNRFEREARLIFRYSEHIFFFTRIAGDNFRGYYF